MCLTMMWESPWMGLQPQLSHYTAVCPPGGNQNSRAREDSKSLANRSSGNMERTDTYAHPHHVKVAKHVQYVRHLMLKPTWVGLWVQLLHCTVVCPLVGRNRIPREVPKAWPTRAAVIYGKDRYICTSTSYEGCETPYLCLTLIMWKWKPTQMGL